MERERERTLERNRVTGTVHNDAPESKVLQYDAEMVTKVLLSFACCRKADQRLADKKLGAPAAPKQGFFARTNGAEGCAGGTANFQNWRSSQQSVSECGWDRRRPLTRELSEGATA